MAESVEKAYQKKEVGVLSFFCRLAFSRLAPAFQWMIHRSASLPQRQQAFTVISRSSGEGQDRKMKREIIVNGKLNRAIFRPCPNFYEHSAVLLNVGGVIDTSFIDQNPTLDSVLLISQPGMQAGNAVAEILSGNSTPSGKLTDTWAYNYSDYYSANSFGPKRSPLSRRNLRRLLAILIASTSAHGLSLVTD